MFITYTLSTNGLIAWIYRRTCLSLVFLWTWMPQSLSYYEYVMFALVLALLSFRKEQNWLQFSSNNYPYYPISLYRWSFDLFCTKAPNRCELCSADIAKLEIRISPVASFIYIYNIYMCVCVYIYMSMAQDSA